MSSRNRNQIRNQNIDGNSAYEKKEDKAKTLCLSVSNNPVMLQTIQVTAADVKEAKNIHVNVIFDGGSQKTYLSQRLVDALMLNPIGKQEMKINAFGQSDGTIKTLNEYNFCLKGKQAVNRYHLKGFAVPVICAPLNNHRVDIRRITLEHEELNSLISGR